MDQLAIILFNEKETFSADHPDGTMNEPSSARQRCEECNEKTSLYQCPGCMIRTCSLKCCQAHKKRTKCSGKRSRGKILPLCRMDDDSLRSDYFFMEEVLEMMPRASKISKLAEENSMQSIAHRSTTSMNSRKKSKRLVQQAERRGITLQVMPCVMERHKKNSSWYCSPRDLITWKTEVVIIPTHKIYSINISEQEEEILIS